MSLNKQDKSFGKRINRVEFRKASSNSPFEYEYARYDQNGAITKEWAPVKKNSSAKLKGKEHLAISAARQFIQQQGISVQGLTGVEYENSHPVINGLLQALAAPLQLPLKDKASFNNVDLYGDLKPRVLELLRSQTDLGKLKDGKVLRIK